MIGIIGAMPVEVQTLVEQMEAAERKRISGMPFCHGRLFGQKAVVALSGVGKVNAAMCAEAMILCEHPDLIVNIGVAGAMTARFRVGDIAVARDLVQYDVDTSALGDPVGMVSTVNRIDFPCAPWAVEAILKAVRGCEGLRALETRIASGDRFNDSAWDKGLLVDYFRAEVCEMEGCPIAQVCYINGVDFAAIRAISDAASGEHADEYARSRDLAASNAIRALEAFLRSFPEGYL